MSALVIGPEETAAIAALRERAATAPITVMRAPTPADAEPMRAANGCLTIGLPRGYLVTLTHEIQPTGRYLHLSVSVQTEDRLPSPEAVQLILDAFGMRPLPASVVWIEQIARGHEAVNVLQILGPLPGERLQ